MSDDLVLHEVKGRVSYVTLNRADKLNAISNEVRLAAMDRFSEADAEPSTRVVVLRGAGRAFSAGYDITAEYEGDDHSWRHDSLAWRELLLACLEFEMRPMEMRKPVIASVAGYAVGGACELAMFCDLTICADNAKFGEPEVRFSNVGPAMIMPFIIGHKRAREMLYMGDLIDAQTALECNMVNRVVATEALGEETEKYANRLALLDEEALYGTKVALRRGLEATGLRAAMLNGVDVLASMYAAKTEIGGKFGKITQADGLRAALKWRHAQFEE